jgi:hypothetical protein
MSMTANILRALRESDHALSKAEIAALLDFPSSGNVARIALNDLGHELFAMAQAGMIAFDHPNAARPEYSFHLPASAP